MRHLGLGWLAVALLLGAAGCGEKVPETATVNNTAVLGGYALSSLLTFLNVWVTARLMFASHHDLQLATVLLLFASAFDMVDGSIARATNTVSKFGGFFDSTIDRYSEIVVYIADGFASRETLLRRVTYDLTGLPPTYAEIEAFLSDNSPNAFEKVVDRLLASPRYGERMAMYWLDLVRYCDVPESWAVLDAGHRQRGMYFGERMT